MSQSERTDRAFRAQFQLVCGRATNLKADRDNQTRQSPALAQTRVTLHVAPIFRRTGPYNIVSNHNRAFLVQEFQFLGQLRIRLAERLIYLDHAYMVSNLQWIIVTVESTT